MGLFEELDREHRGQTPEDIEVIPLDDVSHRRGDDHAAEIPGDFNSHVGLLFTSRSASLFLVLGVSRRRLSRGETCLARGIWTSATIVSARASNTPASGEL